MLSQGLCVSRDHKFAARLKLLAAVCLLGFSNAGCQQSDQPAEGPGATNEIAFKAPQSDITPAGTAPAPAAATSNSKESAPLPVIPEIRFDNEAAARNLDFTYENGARGRLLMVESIGGGAGWIDVDRDDRPDVFLTQGGIPDSAQATDRPLDAIFRQQTSGNFANTTTLAGLDDRAYSQGAAVGDLDNDGFEDLFVTNVGQNVMYRNMGDGTFERADNALPPIDPRWSSTAAWADLDQDGLLDLYVCNYLQYDPMNPLECLKDGQPALCHPRQLNHWPDECYRNNGDGSFERVTERWGLFGEGNKALGVAIADFTDDGRPDIYVANDTTANFLFVSQPDGTFQDEAFRRGVAFSGSGDAQASMGVAVADYDENGLLDILLSHFTGESNTLYKNKGEFGMQDVSSLTGIRKLSFPRLGFGIVMEDFNCDGRMDNLVANGHIDERNADYDGYEQHPQLLTFDGSVWQDASPQGGPWFQQKLVGRGIATGDIDNDGDLDAIVVHQNSKAALLVNNSKRGNWLQLRFIGNSSNRNGIGCRVTATSGQKTLSTQLAGGTSFASSRQPILVMGYGPESTAADVEIRWPSGIVQKLEGLRMNQIHQIREPRMPSVAQ